MHYYEKTYLYEGMRSDGKKFLIKKIKDNNMGLIYNNTWVHFIEIWEKDWTYRSTVHLNIKTNEKYDNVTMCGKMNNSGFIEKTKDWSEVTCKYCLEKMKDQSWYCEECNLFLDGDEVTNDECCIHCGGEL